MPAPSGEISQRSGPQRWCGAGAAFHAPSPAQRSPGPEQRDADEAGRLLVLGGFGTSASVQPANPLRHYANNDDWYDDVADGPLSATVRLGPDGRQVPVTSAWCVVGPTDHAPAVPSLATLYDVALEVARASGGLPTPPEVSFTRDIYPLLARPVLFAWVNKRARERHGDPRRNFLTPSRLARLSSKEPDNATARQIVFERLRKPGLVDDTSQANEGFMPVLSGDDGDAQRNKPRTWLTLLPDQYARVQRWADGDFLADWTGVPAPLPFEALAPADQPHALVRAALETASGGGFFPGIEMTYIADRQSPWAAPFRLREDLVAGDVTKYMALPWQADSYMCRDHWWPASRPDEVLVDAHVIPQAEVHVIPQLLT